jgi:glycosyltransferase involved in cell wall biosynthesis
VWVIPNARRPDRFVAVDREAASAALRSRAGIEAGTPIIGLVGHLVEQKQPELAVDLLAVMRDRGAHAHLVIAGDGPRRGLVEQRIGTHGLDRAVTLLGHRDDPEHVYGGIDIAVITSRAEGIPGVAIEAQMSGCPVVAFPVGAVGDVVEDQVTGVVLARADVGDMADAVIALLGDHDRLRTMGAAARSRSQRFSAASVATIYADRLVKAFSEHRSARTANA